ncbi:MAG TPA: hypothetical protein VK760_04300 [Candidatus Acidoferrales bacterium]|nr:hypothetical protein [Candidatus Acidoferrales bacterium]
MSTSAVLAPSVRAAFGALVDYAGLFPPAKLAMPDAVAEYDAARRGPYAWMLGRFIVPASRLAELTGAIGGLEPFALSVIVDADADARRWFGSAQRCLGEVAAYRLSEPRIRIEALEAALPPLLSQRETYDATLGQFAGLVSRAGLRDLEIYTEWPRDERWHELLPSTMTAAARSRIGAKIRCGGLTPDAYPSVADVAAFVDAAATEHVAFKATAGLHHPVRHHNAQAGVYMHGFLNLVAAAALAHRVSRETLEQIVAEEDPAAFAFDDESMTWRDDRVALDELTAARGDDFVAYGSCSFSEPVDDLTALTILPRGA